MLSKGGSGEITLYVYNSDHKDIQWLNGKGKDISKTLKFSVKSHKKGKVNKYDCYKTAVTFKVTGLKEGCLNVKAKKKVISSNKCRYSIYSKMKEDGFTVNGNHSPLQGASNSSSAKKKDGKEILVKEATGAKIIGKCGKYYYVKVKGVNGFLKKSDVAYLKLKKSKKSMYRYHKGHLDAKIQNNPNGKYKVEWKIIKNQGKITDIQYTTNKGYNRIKFFADKPTDKFRIRVQCKYADGKYIHKDIRIKIKDIKIIFPKKISIEVGQTINIKAKIQTLPKAKITYEEIKVGKDGKEKSSMTTTGKKKNYREEAFG